MFRLPSEFLRKFANFSFEVALFFQSDSERAASALFSSWICFQHCLDSFSFWSYGLFVFPCPLSVQLSNCWLAIITKVPGDAQISVGSVPPPPAFDVRKGACLRWSFSSLFFKLCLGSAPFPLPAGFSCSGWHEVAGLGRGQPGCCVWLCTQCQESLTLSRKRPTNRAMAPWFLGHCLCGTRWTAWEGTPNCLGGWIVIRTSKRPHCPFPAEVTLGSLGFPFSPSHKALLYYQGWKTNPGVVALSLPCFNP